MYASRGFSLIEAIVALAIMSMVAAGALGIVSQGSRFSADTEDRLHARILAENILVERLAQRAPLPFREEAQERAFAGRAWSCREAVIDIGVDGVVRIEVSISRLDDPQTLVSLSTLKRQS
ncbi:MAG: type II secretion system protein [Pseudomonadota bacterium]